MEDKKMYATIVKMAILILVGLSLIVAIVMQDALMFVSTMIGGTLSIISFLWIVVMTNKMDFNKKVTLIVFMNFIFRYLIYFLVFYECYQLGLNIITMLIGFLCISISIKLYTHLEERRKIN